MRRTIMVFFLACVLFFTALVLLACGGCHPQKVAAPEPVVDEPMELIDQQYGAALQLEVTCTNVKKLAPGLTATTVEAAWGSGVAISSTRALTAYHVVEGGKCDVVATDVDGVKRNMRVEVTVVEADLAKLVLVDTGGGFGVWAPMVGPQPKRGERICTATGKPWRARQCGYVEPYRDGKSDDLVHSAFVQPGNSGSGVYDRQGRLVAIVTRLRSCKISFWHQACGGAATSLWVHRWLAS